MIIAIAVLLALAWQALPPTPSYFQSYVVFIRGEPSGTETVTETPDGKGNIISASEHSLLIADGNEIKRMSFVTSMTLAKNGTSAVAYTLRYTSGGSSDYIDLKVQGGQIHRELSRGGRVSEVSQALGPDTVIFDFNVYHQFDYLARRYDFKKKGRQVFQNFIPIVGAEIPLALTWLEDGELEYAKGKMPVRNYRFDISGVMAGVFSLDKANRLVRLLVREKDLEVLRQDLVPEESPAAPPPPAPPSPP
jgi:hypothetical protein